MRWMWPLVWEPGKILSLVHFLICPQSQLPTLIKSTRHPDLLTHHLYFWSPPLQNALLSLSPSVSPLKLHLHSLYHPLPCCYRQLPVDFISYGSLPNFMAPTLWFTLYGSTSHTRLLIVLVSFPVALIKYPRQELREERFYFAHNSKLQPMVVGKSRQQEPEVHSQEQPENESMHASSCSVNSLLFTWSRAQPIKMVSFIQDIGLPTSVNSSNNSSQAKLYNCSLILTSQWFWLCQSFNQN